MRLYQLEYFLKIVECGSITKAAQELYLSQPSLTKAIAGLESEYNIKLFSRTAKGISLTTDGLEFLEYARNIVENCQALEKTFGQGKSVQFQRLAIASQQFDFLYDMMMEAYEKADGQMFQIDLKETDRGEVVELVEGCKANIGLLVVTEDDSKVFKSVLQSKNLEMHVLDCSVTYVNMGEKCALYDKEYVDVKECEKYLQMMLDMELSTRRELAYRESYHGYDNRHMIFCNTIGMCRKFLEETDMIVLTPKWVTGFFKDSNIRSVPYYQNGSVYVPKSRLVWIKRINEELHPLETYFVEMLKARFRKTN